MAIEKRAGWRESSGIDENDEMKRLYLNHKKTPPERG